MLRHPNFCEPDAWLQVIQCYECGRGLPFPELARACYEEDSIRRLAELLIAGGGDRDDAVMLAKAWLKMCE